MAYPFLRGVDEYQVVDSRNLPQFLSRVRLHPFVSEGQERLNAKTLKLVPEDEFATIGCPHGKPRHFAVVHKCSDETKKV